MLLLVFVVIFIVIVVIVKNLPRYDPSNDATLHPVRLDHYVRLLHPLYLLLFYLVIVVLLIVCYLLVLSNSAPQL